MVHYSDTIATSRLRGRRVMVTGGAGFLGRHVCRELRKYSPQSVFVPRRREYDLREREAILRALHVSRPQLVIHLAANVGGIGANRENPASFFYDNAIMGIQLMEQSRLFGVEKFVAVGTVCSYPENTPVPFREHDLWNGYPEPTNAPYGLAKKMLLVQAQASRQQYGFNAVTLLPVNLYGPGDNFSPKCSHVIPAIIHKALQAIQQQCPVIDLWGSGNASREFLFVRDAARAIVLAAAVYDQAPPLNLGSGEEITIRQLAHLVCRLCGFHGELRWEPSMPDGQPRRCLDTTQARAALGFAARTQLEDGLRETILWYRRQAQAHAENEVTWTEDAPSWTTTRSPQEGPVMDSVHEGGNQP